MAWNRSGKETEMGPSRKLAREKQFDWPLPFFSRGNSANLPPPPCLTGSPSGRVLPQGWEKMRRTGGSGRAAGSNKEFLEKERKPEIGLPPLLKRDYREREREYKQFNNRRIQIKLLITVGWSNSGRPVIAVFRPRRRLLRPGHSILDRYRVLPGDRAFRRLPALPGGRWGRAPPGLREVREDQPDPAGRLFPADHRIPANRQILKELFSWGHRGSYQRLQEFLGLREWQGNWGPAVLALPFLRRFQGFQGVRWGR